MSDGYIKIFRQIRDHWTYQRSEYFHAWFEMLACAKYTREPEKRMIEGSMVTISYGEFVFGRISWSRRLGIPESVLRGFIKKLISDDMIELIKKTNKYSIFKVKNFEKFNLQSDQQIRHENQRVEACFDQQTTSR